MVRSLLTMAPTLWGIKNCTLLTCTVTLQNYAILWWFWHIEAQENILSPACLTVFVKSKTENQLIRFFYCLLSSRQQRKMWNSCCNARPQTSLLQTYGLLTVLTLILWIIGYVEYRSNVIIGNLLKLNADELKLRLIEVWLGIQQSITDQAIDEWRVHLDACVKAKGKHIENMLWCAGPQLSIICYET